MFNDSSGGFSIFRRFPPSVVSSFHPFIDRACLSDVSVTAGRLGLNKTSGSESLAAVLFAHLLRIDPILSRLVRWR